MSTNDISSIHNRALQLTAEFEGHGFEKAAGNFDGAGITWGIIGFTLLHGEIQKIIKKMKQENPNILEEAFGGLKDKLLSIMDSSKDEQIAWANDISVGVRRYRILPEWEKAFKKLGSFKEVQKIQLESVKKYWDIAERDVNRFDLKTEAGFALCFDIAVQNGGIDFEGEERRIKREIKESSPSDEQDIRTTIANVVAENSRPQYIEDVRSRKLTIAIGKGVIHGSKYNIKSWGVGDFTI